MKFKIAWSSPIQGIQYTTVDALNTFAAREQFESMYGNIEGLSIISIGPVFDKKEYSEPEESYNVQSESSGGESDYDFSAVIGGGSIAAGFFIAIFGLFTLPTGIIAMVVGGAVGWVGWKLACWLSDRGW
jgi:hypothetical protein